MRRRDLSRRDFARLTAAAVGGLAAGSLTGCPQATPPPPTPPATGGSTRTAGGAANFLLGEQHACRGLNLCMGQDKDGDNACAGQGDCATIATHSCQGQNECNGQGGCGETPAQNACKGQGSCGIPMHAGAWDKARAVFEARMKDQSKQFGAAPAAAE